MLVFGIIEFFTLFIGLTYLLKVPLTKTLLSIALIWLTTLFMLYYFISEALTLLLSFTSLVLLFYFLLKKKQVILDVSIIFIMGVFSDNLAQLVNLSFDSNKIHIFIFLLLFVLMLIFYKWLSGKFIHNFSDQLTLKCFVSILFLFFLTIIIFSINVFILHSKSFNLINMLLQGVYLILIIVLIIVLFILLITKTKKDYEVEKNKIIHEQFQQHIQMLTQTNKGLQKFQHDYLNILLALRAYIDENDIEGLQEYFYNHILIAEKKNFVRNQILKSLNNIKILEVKSILISKLNEASQYEIDINVEIPQPIIKLSIKLIDIVRVLGIYLDNAIEASKNTKDAQINIAILLISGKSVVIVIENSCDIDQIDINQLFTRSYTTKGMGRGQGLNNAQDILGHYSNITYNTYLEKSFFVQEIQIDLIE
ncbi:GHKL domain-containing protein [Bacillus sp. H1a]|uniref:sensor histidine kinase n=1 Tax=Bacillus sp. H1a TaxID=1397276 RepID=UPI000468B777|nr:GHKL domain-containing protein [Bacillus sp. H1a]